MKLAILLALLGNLKIAACISITLGIVSGSALLLGDLTEDHQRAMKLGKKILIVAALLIPFALMPNADDLWEARIALVKLQLASPDNINKGVDYISKISKKLEHKYLEDKNAKN